MVLIDLILRTPLVNRVVMVPVLVAGLLQRHLGPEADFVERWRQRLWVRARDSLGTRTTGYARRDEYVCSVDCRPETLERTLWKQGFRRNLIATKKARVRDGPKEWSISSWVHREHLWAESQLHLTTFERDDGGVDCYLHYEASNLTHPLQHWRANGQEAGDPNGTFRAALSGAGVEYFDDDSLGTR